MKILIVEAVFYPDLAEALRSGARAALEEAGAQSEIISVPGSLEIPAAIRIAGEGGGYDGFVALGCVIRGETGHYEIVAGESARGLMELATGRGWAIGNGIVTVENRAQAEARAEQKGRAAAAAALALARLRGRFAAQGG